jgi:hypothetical protein
VTRVDVCFRWCQDEAEPRRSHCCQNKGIGAMAALLFGVISLNSLRLNVGVIGDGRGKGFVRCFVGASSGGDLPSLCQLATHGNGTAPQLTGEIASHSTFAHKSDSAMHKPQHLPVDSTKAAAVMKDRCTLELRRGQHWYRQMRCVGMLCRYMRPSW